VNAPRSTSEFRKAQSAAVTSSERFGGLLHDLRELFYSIEMNIPRRDRLPERTRGEIVGQHGFRNSNSAYIHTAVHRSADKLRTHAGWDEALSIHHPALLSGILTYAEMFHRQKSLVGSERKFCEDVIAFCKAHGATPIDMPRHRGDPDLDAWEQWVMAPASPQASHPTVKGRAPIT
jgi:hypothetical protein